MGQQPHTVRSVIRSEAGSGCRLPWCVSTVGAPLGLSVLDDVKVGGGDRRGCCLSSMNKGRLEERRRVPAGYGPAHRNRLQDPPARHRQARRYRCRLLHQPALWQDVRRSNETLLTLPPPSRPLRERVSVYGQQRGAGAGLPARPQARDRQVRRLRDPKRAAQPGWCSVLTVALVVAGSSGHGGPCSPGQLMRMWWCICVSATTPSRGALWVRHSQVLLRWATEAEARLVGR